MLQGIPVNLQKNKPSKKQGIPVRQLECAQPYKIPNCFEFCEHVLTAGKIKIVLVLRIDSVRINGGQPWMMSDSQCCMNLMSLGS